MATEPTGIWRVIDRVQSVGGVASVIATMIAASICVRFLLDGNASKPPEGLGHALSVILGFYFGARTVRPSKDAKPNSN